MRVKPSSQCFMEFASVVFETKLNGGLVNEASYTGLISKPASQGAEITGGIPPNGLRAAHNRFKDAVISSDQPQPPPCLSSRFPWPHAAYSQESAVGFCLRHAAGDHCF